MSELLDSCGPCIFNGPCPNQCCITHLPEYNQVILCSADTCCMRLFGPSLVGMWTWDGTLGEADAVKKSCGMQIRNKEACGNPCAVRFGLDDHGYAVLAPCPAGEPTGLRVPDTAQRATLPIQCTTPPTSPEWPFVITSAIPATTTSKVGDMSPEVTLDSGPRSDESAGPETSPEPSNGPVVYTASTTPIATMGSAMPSMSTSPGGAGAGAAVDEPSLATPTPEATSTDNNSGSHNTGNISPDTTAEETAYESFEDIIEPSPSGATPALTPDARRHFNGGSHQAEPSPELVDGPTDGITSAMPIAGIGASSGTSEAPIPESDAGTEYYYPTPSVFVNHSSVPIDWTGSMEPKFEASPEVMYESTEVEFTAEDCA